MSTEKPTIPESIFVYVMNLIIIDAARRLIMKLTPCDILKQDDIDDLLLMLNTMQKEHDNAFDVEAEEEKHTNENVHMNEQENKNEETP